jgi:ketosteroid isomerase-like protein
MEKGDLDTLNRIFAPDGPWHLPGGETRLQGGPSKSLAEACPMCAHLSKRSIQIEVLVAQGEYVAVRSRWSGDYSGEPHGVSIQNKPVVLTYQNIYRVRNGKIVENWADYNGMDLLRQLGFTIAH